MYEYPDWSMVRREVIRNEVPLLLQEAREPDHDVHLQLPQQDVHQLPRFSHAHAQAGSILSQQFSLWTQEASS